MDPQVNQSSQTDSSGVSFGSPEVVVPPSSPSTPAVPIPPELPKQSLFLVKLAQVLLGVSILAIIAYFVGTFVTAKKVTLTPTPSVLPSPVATIDPMADWKTYTNARLAFSFQYPNDLLITSQGPDQNTNTVFFVSSEAEKVKVENCIKQIECYSYPFRIMVNNTKKDANLSLENYLIKIGYSQGDDTQEVFVDGMRGLKINFEGVGSGSNIFISLGSESVVHINTNAIQEEQANLKTLNQILSTFKFLEAGATPSATPQ